MKKKIPLIALNVFFVLAFIACIIASGILSGTLRSQQAAEAFAGETGERYAQVSAFIPEAEEIDGEAVFILRDAIDKELTAASLEEDDSGSTLYRDAYSASGEINISAGGSPTEAVALGVGGDFFLFHPLNLRDGSYLEPDDLMKDRVVLDEELAWRLFGSAELEGMSVSINGIPHLIAGVVSREDDFASEKTYKGGASLFMSYESLNSMSEEGAGIDCYEIVMPDLISGFAKKTLETTFPVETAVIVENSVRFDLISLFNKLKNFGTSSLQTEAVVYPYWENAARYIEDWLALLLAMSLLLIVFPAVCAVFYGVKGIRYLLKKGRVVVSEKIEEHHERAAEAYLLKEIDESVSSDIDDIIREIREEEKKSRDEPGERR